MFAGEGHFSTAMVKTIVRTPPGDTAVGVVLWAHGGCFTNGDETWDSTLAEFLCKRGFLVVTADYRQGQWHPWPAGSDDLQSLYSSLVREHAPLPVHVGGASSGGFFAYDVACKTRAPKCALLCPVLDAYKRYEILDDVSVKKHKQRLYFGTLEHMQSVTEQVLGQQRPADLFIVTGSHDIDAPAFACFPTLPCYSIRGATHAMCTRPPVEALEAICDYLSG